MRYPTYSEIELSTDEQIEYWFLNLPKMATKMEEILFGEYKWILISDRYYNGEDTGNDE